MIMLWNRKEVYNGFDIGQLARVRDTLWHCSLPLLFKFLWIRRYTIAQLHITHLS